MKVILFNGSRRENGCTYTALNIPRSQGTLGNGGRRCLRFSGLLRLSEWRNADVPRSPLRYRRSESAIQAGRKRGFRTPCRDDRNSRCAQQVPDLCATAARDFALLEHGSWIKSGRCAERRRRRADYEGTGPQYGMASQEH